MHLYWGYCLVCGPQYSQCLSCMGALAAFSWWNLASSHQKVKGNREGWEREAQGQNLSLNPPQGEATLGLKWRGSCFPQHWVEVMSSSLSGHGSWADNMGRRKEFLAGWAEGPPSVFRCAWCDCSPCHSENERCEMCHADCIQSSSSVTMPQTTSNFPSAALAGKCKHEVRWLPDFMCWDHAWGAASFIILSWHYVCLLVFCFAVFQKYV